ncbi:hypothetical protein HPP92_000664 [Vanilla planifolia]|uniref:Uncharacterized protein n=1 Tax=Vanilla planifolia TaxID=51239 RepID=A0A835RPH3_VANPL|nr:hypothetical protein HPP92_000776 [Vanilla planifolia]KAG0500592.1 hypothetical protein HPP92_000664 [Vanilla planifolia]
MLAALYPLPGESSTRAICFGSCRFYPRREFVEDRLFLSTDVHIFLHPLSSRPLGDRTKFHPGLIHEGFYCFASPTAGSAGYRSGDRYTTKWESIKDISGLKSSIRGRKRRDAKGASQPSTFDFLELKRALGKEENTLGDSKEGNLGPQGSEEFPSSSKKEVSVVGRPTVGGGRQIIRRSNLLAKQVISMESARSLGFVSQLWVDTRRWIVKLIEVRLNLLSGDSEKFLLKDVYKVGDVVLVRDESVMENELDMTGLDSLVGYNLVKRSRRSIGKIRGYSFNINSGSVEMLEFDSFGFSIIPSSLVSSYCLLVDNVVDVEPDKVMVHEEALSHVQRLTKGIWDAGCIQQCRDDHDTVADFRRKRINTDRRRRRPTYGDTNSPHKEKEEDDDWDLPMEY